MNSITIDKILSNEFVSERQFLIAMIRRRPTFCRSPHKSQYDFLVPDKYKHLGRHCGDQNGPDFRFDPALLEELSDKYLSDVYWAMVQAHDDVMI